MKTIWIAVLLVACSCGVFAAEPAESPAPASPFEQGIADLERNTALGAMIETRPATEIELGELRVLADRGLKQARALVVQTPDSADAHYLLGSWLLYGYRVVQVDEITFDASGASGIRTVNRVILGLTDDPEEGLAALAKASELAPDNGDYLLDYAAALGDSGRLTEARGILKGIWGGTPALSTLQTMRAGFLLAGVSEAEGDLSGAREWVYAALALEPDTAMGVELLRHLDAAAAAEWRAALDAAVAAAQAGFEEEYYAEPEASEVESYEGQATE
jgi:hypothetical protein